MARLLVSLLALAAFAGVGLLSRGAKIEERLPPAAGWALWSVVLMATVLLARHRGGSPLGTSVGSRLGAVPGHGPGLVFLVTAAALVTQAVLVGPSPLPVAALAPALVFLLVGGGDIHRAALVAWRQRMHGRLAGVESLVAVLMKRRNDQPWTREERAFLQTEFRAMARYLPALVLFILPGSVVLLPLYAWLLDRRRGTRGDEAARRIVAGPGASAGGRRTDYS